MAETENKVIVKINGVATGTEYTNIQDALNAISSDNTAGAEYIVELAGTFEEDVTLEPNFNRNIVFSTVEGAEKATIIGMVNLGYDFTKDKNQQGITNKGNYEFNNIVFAAEAGTAEKTTTAVKIGAIDGTTGSNNFSSCDFLVVKKDEDGKWQVVETYTENTTLVDVPTSNSGCHRTTFVDCTFSDAKLSFMRGDSTESGKCEFSGCTFTDAMVNSSSGNGWYFTNCKFSLDVSEFTVRNNDGKNIYMVQYTTSNATPEKPFENCKFKLTNTGNVDLGDAAKGQFRDAIIIQSRSSDTEKYKIDTNAVAAKGMDLSGVDFAGFDGVDDVGAVANILYNAKNITDHAGNKVFEYATSYTEDQCALGLDGVTVDGKDVTPQFILDKTAGSANYDGYSIVNGVVADGTLVEEDSWLTEIYDEISDTEVLYVDSSFSSCEDGDKVVIYGKIYTVGINAFASVDDAVAVAADDAAVRNIVAIPGKDATLHLDVFNKNEDVLTIDMGNNKLSFDENGGYIFNGSSDLTGAVGAEIGFIGTELTIGENVVVKADVLWANDNTRNIDGTLYVNGVYVRDNNVNVAGTLNVADNFVVIDSSGTAKTTIEEGGEFTAKNVYVKKESYNFDVNGTANVSDFNSEGTVYVGTKGTLNLTGKSDIAVLNNSGKLNLTGTDVEKAVLGGSITNYAEFYIKNGIADTLCNNNSGIVELVGSGEFASVENNGEFTVSGDGTLKIDEFSGNAIEVTGGTLTDSTVNGGIIAFTGDTYLKGSNEFSCFWVSGGALTVEGELITQTPYPAFFAVGDDSKVSVAEKTYFGGFNGTEAGHLVINGTYTAEEGVVSGQGKLTVNGKMTAPCLYLRGGETIVNKDGELSGIVWGSVDAGASLTVDGGKFATKIGDSWVPLSIGGDLKVTKNGLVEHGGNVINTGTISIDATSSFIANSFIDSTGSIVIDAGNFVSTRKLVDVAFDSIADDNVSVINKAEGSKADKLIFNNDLYITDVTQDTLYVASEYSSKPAGTVLDDGNIIGFNAFASFADALKNITGSTSRIEILSNIKEEGPSDEITVELSKNLTITGENVTWTNAGGWSNRVIFNGGDDITLTFDDIVFRGGVKPQNTAMVFSVNTVIEAGADVEIYNGYIDYGKTLEVKEGGKFACVDEAFHVYGNMIVAGNEAFSAANATAADRQVFLKYTDKVYGSLEISDTYLVSSQYFAVCNSSNAKMTIDNSLVELGKDYAGKWVSNPYSSGENFIAIQNGGSVTVENNSVLKVSGASIGSNRTFASKGYGLTVGADSTFEVLSGSYAEFGTGIDNNGTITINDSEFRAGTNFVEFGGTNIPYFDFQNSKTVKVISGTLEAGAVTNNGEFTVSSTDGKSSTLKIDFLTGNAIVAEDGAIIENSQVGGTVQVAGNVTFRGDNVFTWMTDCEKDSADTASWTVEAGASLTLTQEGRFKFGFGDDITINGNIVSGGAAAARATLSDADSDNDVKCSFFVNGLWAFSDNGYTADSTFTVNNAYVVIGKSNSFGHPSSNDPYSGGMIFNFNNSVLDSSRLTFYDQGIKTTFNLSGSDVRVGTFMTADQDSVFTLDNSTVLTNGTNTERDKNLNAGTLNVKNSSDLTYTELFTNTGLVYVEKSALNAEDITNDKEIILNNAELDVAVLENNKDILVEGETTLNVGKDYLVDLTFDNIGTLSGEAVVRGLDSEGNKIAEYAVNLPKRATSHRFKGVKADRYVIYLGDNKINVTGVEYTNGGLKSGSNAIIIKDGATLVDSNVAGPLLEPSGKGTNPEASDAYTGYVLSVNGDQAGTVYFKGTNQIASLDAAAGDIVIVDGADSSLEFTGDGFKLGNGAKWQITNGANVSGWALSLDNVADGKSFDSEMLVKDAAVTVSKISAKGTKPGTEIGAGKFDVTFDKATVNLTGTTAIEIPEQDTAKINLTFKNETTIKGANGSDSIQRLKNDSAVSAITFDNTDVNIVQTFRNKGIINIQNGADVVAENLYLTGEHYSANEGTINVADGTLQIVTPNAAFVNSGTVKVSGDSAVSADFTGSGELVFDNGVLSDKIAVSGNQTVRFTGVSEITDSSNFDVTGLNIVGTMQTVEETEEQLENVAASTLTISSDYNAQALWVGARCYGKQDDKIANLIVSGEDTLLYVGADGDGDNRGLNIRESGAVTVKDKAQLTVNKDDAFVVKGALNIENGASAEALSSGVQIYAGGTVTVSGGLLTLGGYNDTDLRLGAVNESNGNVVTRREDGAGYIRLENGAKLVLNETFNIIHGEFVIDWSSCIEYNETITLNKYSNFGLNDGKFSIDYENFDKGTYLLMNYTGTGTALDYSKLVSNWSNDLVVFNGDLYISGADRSVIYVDASYTETGAIIGDKIVGVNAFSNINDAIGAMTDVTKTISVNGTIDSIWPGQEWEGTQTFDYALNFQKTNGADEAVINAYKDAQWYSLRFAKDLTIGEGVTLNLFNDGDWKTHWDNMIDFAPAGDSVTVNVAGTLVYSTGNFGAGAKENGVYAADDSKTIYVKVSETGKMFASGEGNVSFFSNSDLDVRGTGKDALQFSVGTYAQFGGKVNFEDTRVRVWGTSIGKIDAASNWMGMGYDTFTGDGKMTVKNSRLEFVDGIMTYSNTNQAPASNAGLPETSFESLNRNYVYFNKDAEFINSDIYAGDMFINGKTVSFSGGLIDLKSDVGQTDNRPNPLVTSGNLTVAEGAELNLTGSTIDVEGLDNAGSVIVTGESTLNVGKLSGGITFGSAAAASEITADIKEGSTGDIFIADESTVTLKGALATDGTIHNSVYDYADGKSKGYDLTIAEGADIRAAAIYISGGSEMTVKAGGKFGAFFTNANGFRDGTLNVYGSTLNVEKDAEVTTVTNHVTGDLDIKGNYTATGINIYTAREGKRSGKVTVSGAGAVLDMTSNGTLNVGGSTVLDDKKYAAADEWKKAELVISDNAVVKVANALTNYNSEGRLYVYGNGIVTITGATLQVGYGIENYGSITVTDGIIESWKCDATANIPTVINSYDNAVFTVAGASSITVDAFNGNMDVAGTSTITISDIAGYVKLAEESSMDAVSYTGTLDAATAGTVTADDFSGTMNLSGTGIIDIDNFAGTMKVAGDVVLNAESDIDFTGSDDVVEIGSSFTFQLGDLEGVENWTAGEGAIVSITDVTLPANGSTVTVIAGKNNFTEENLIINSSSVVDGQIIIGEVTGGIVTGDVVYKIYDVIGDNETGWTVQEHIAVSEDDVYTPITLTVSSVTQAENSLNFTINADAEGGMGGVKLTYIIDGVEQSGNTFTLTDLSQELVSVVVKATDQFGASTEITQDLLVNVKDYIAPTLGEVSASETGWTNGDVTVFITGAKDNFDNGVSTWYSTDGGTTWQKYTDGVKFTENGTVLFKAIDAALNETAAEDIIKYEVNNIDKYAPELTVAVGGKVSPDWTDEDVTLSASATDENAVSIQYNDGTGWNDYTGDITLSESGKYTYEFKAVDASGKTASETVSVWIDKDAPVLSVSSGEYAGGWTGNDVVLTASATDATLASFKYTVDGGNTWNDYTGDITLSSSGVYDCRFTATDIFGKSTTGSIEVMIDKAAPELTVETNGYDGSWTNKAVTLNAAASDDNTYSIEYSIDGGNTWTAGSDVVVNTNGSFEYMFRVTDAAGKTGVETVKVNYDDVPAVLTVTGNPADWIEITDSAWPVKLSASVNEADCIIEYNDYGNRWEKYDAAQGVIVYKNGTVNFKVTDKAGNITTQTVEVSKIWSDTNNDAPDTPDVPGEEFDGTVNVGKKLDIKESSTKYADVAVEMPTGNTTVNIGSGKVSSAGGVGTLAVEIGSISKADGAAGVNNVKIGKYADVKIHGTIEELGKLSTGKYTALDVDDTITGTAARQTISTGSGNNVDFADIDLKGGNDTLKIGADNRVSAGDIRNVEKISVGSRSDVNAGMITGVNKLRTSKGAAADRNVFDADGISGLLGKNDTVSFGNYNTVRLDYKVDLLSGKDTLKIGKNSSFFAPEVSNVEIIKTGAGTDFFAEKVSGVNKFTASGSKNSSGCIEIMDLAGTAGNDTVSLGNYNDAFIGTVNLGAGNDQLKLGSNSELIVDVIDFGAGNDTLSIGKNSVVSVTEIKGMETLKGSKGSTLEINNGADTDVKFDSTLKGSWDKVTVLDDAGELALGDNGINVYANEWDVFEFASPESGKLTLESSDAVKFEYRFAGADNWLVYSEGSAIALNGNDLSIRVSVDLEEKKDKFAKFSASFKAELA